jgi:hypothetical protein
MWVLLLLTVILFLCGRAEADQVAVRVEYTVFDQGGALQVSFPSVPSFGSQYVVQFTGGTLYKEVYFMDTYPSDITLTTDYTDGVGLQGIVVNGADVPFPDGNIWLDRDAGNLWTYTWTYDTVDDGSHMKGLRVAYTTCSDSGGTSSSTNIELDFPSLPSYEASYLTSPFSSSSTTYEIDYSMTEMPTDIRLISHNSDALCIQSIVVNSVSVPFPDGQVWLDNPCTGSSNYGNSGTDICRIEYTWTFGNISSYGTWMHTYFHTCDSTYAGSTSKNIFVSFPSVPSNSAMALTRSLTEINSWYYESYLMEDLDVNDVLIQSQTSNNLCLDQIRSDVWTASFVDDHIWLDNPCDSSTDPYYYNFCHNSYTWAVMHVPSSTPTGAPSDQPSGQPTGQPSGQPSDQPTAEPSSPSSPPTSMPTSPSSSPTSMPTSPSSSPSSVPTPLPSSSPSQSPTDTSSSSSFDHDFALLGFEIIVFGLLLIVFGAIVVYFVYMQFPASREHFHKRKEAALPVHEKTEEVESDSAATNNPLRKAVIVNIDFSPSQSGAPVADLKYEKEQVAMQQTLKQLADVEAQDNHLILKLSLSLSSNRLLKAVEILLMIVFTSVSLSISHCPTWFCKASVVVSFFIYGFNILIRYVRYPFNPPKRYKTVSRVVYLLKVAEHIKVLEKREYVMWEYGGKPCRVYEKPNTGNAEEIEIAKAYQKLYVAVMKGRLRGKILKYEPFNWDEYIEEQVMMADRINLENRQMAAAANVIIEAHQRELDIATNAKNYAAIEKYKKRMELHLLHKDAFYAAVGSVFIMMDVAMFLLFLFGLFFNLSCSDSGNLICSFVICPTMVVDFFFVFKLTRKEKIDIESFFETIEPTQHVQPAQPAQHGQPPTSADQYL